MRKIFGFLALGSSVLLISCGGDDGFPSTISLNEAEQEAVAGETSGGATVAANSSPSSTNSLVSRMISDVRKQTNISATEFTIDEEREDCEEGGEQTISGTARISSFTTDSFGFSFDMTQVFNNCQVRDEENKTLTLNGSISHVGTISSSIDAESNISLSGDSTTRGSIDVDGAEDGNGTCGINMTSSVSGNETSGTVTYSGNVCGENYSGTESFTS